LDFPADFEEAGVKWTMTTAIPEADLRQLVDYFKLNPSTGEGSLIQGDPTLYTSPRGAKRFYWGRPGTDGAEWIFIQFDGRKATLQEGTGAPLDK
jgi:hypothetical protein